ncbi:hypothetical protein CSPAE12_09507 [Colletotrichum incanum]|nr:hypothetical protein CSPAE12_09507 [Colletotrichum incanum]
MPPEPGNQILEALPKSMAIARKLIRQLEEKEKAEQAAEEAPLYKPIQVGPEVMSVNHFYTSYSANASVSIFSRLPAYYTVDLTDAGHVRHATHAVALLTASKSLRQSGLMMQAKWHYCKALSTLNQALRDPVGVRDDANLVTLFLFGLYELMETFIQRHRLTPLWPVLETVETPWGKGPILEPLVRHVVDFKRAFDLSVQIEGEKPGLGKVSAEELLRLLREGVSLSQDLDAAVTFLGFSSVLTCSEPEQKVFNGLFILSDKMSAGIARSHYRALKIYVLERIMELLNRIRETAGKVSKDLGPMPTWSDGVTVVEEIIEDIQIVFGLEGREHVTAEGMAYRTMTMFWPVVMVRTSCFAGPQNGKWVSETMLELSSNAGFGLGLEAAAM